MIPAAAVEGVSILSNITGPTRNRQVTHIVEILEDEVWCQSHNTAHRIIFIGVEGGLDDECIDE